ncbi:hypothetical protein BOTBODRAFT_122476, partial [Botryobasidium botryosum FD-172 SS1]
SFAPIPKFDDRFARQNRYEPPPEFPLASPYSGIVHHLSGPNMHALPRARRRRSATGVGAPRKGFPTITFITRSGLSPKHSQTC